jgi:hypothetical protein
MIGAAGVQTAVEVTSAVWGRLSARRQQQAAAPLVAGAMVNRESVETFARRLVEDERYQPLLFTVLTSAADTALEPKLRALGAVLANALGDDAKLDLEWLIADALAVIEPAHLRVLSYLGDRRAVNIFGSGVPLAHLQQGLRPIFNVLQSKGLVFESSELREQNVGMPGRVGAGGLHKETVVQHRQQITDFGREVVRRIIEAPSV